jgi:hypothetical protein
MWFSEPEKLRPEGHMLLYHSKLGSYLLLVDNISLILLSLILLSLILLSLILLSLILLSLILLSLILLSLILLSLILLSLVYGLRILDCCELLLFTTMSLY